MKKFKLSAEERGDCYHAVNWGDPDRGGHRIDDTLNKAKPILDAIKKGADVATNTINFKTCDSDSEIILEDHVMNFLIQRLKEAKWETAERALRVRDLVTKLEGVPKVPDKDEEAKTE